MKPQLKKHSNISLTSAHLVDDNSVTLAWQDLSVYVPIKKNGFIPKHVRHRPFKRVLNNGKTAVVPIFFEYSEQ